MDGQVRAHSRVTTNSSPAQETHNILCSSPATEYTIMPSLITSLTLFYHILCKKFTESDVHDHTRTSTFLFMLLADSILILIMIKINYCKVYLPPKALLCGEKKVFIVCV